MNVIISQVLIVYFISFRVAAIVIGVLGILGHGQLAVYEIVILG